ncbi:MAG TPA: gliding motility-associated ABC transporter ATP-binding subunit GldA [Chitinophagaceae bacterium]|nr:gliding motility-associated ABC transporter ATP-binding subunit GldA [Chitinophagaceae bacterium]
MSIQVNGLTKRYGSQTAIDQLSFEVSKGEIVGFLGPNGAGKSTTMKIITGYLPADEGQAKVCGLSVTGEPLASKAKIGYLPESNPLYYDLYVREYLGFIGDLHRIENRRERIEEVIALTGLTPESHKKTGQLSKGYKQRVGLAAALVHDPEVLILDEPTTGLDPNQILEIREVIRQLGKNKTVLFSSHILQEVEAICDRVIIINRGRLVANDSLQKIRNAQSGYAVISVSFREVLEPAWLERLTSVRSVNKTDSHSWTIETSDPDALQKQILELALQQNLNIVSLQSGGQRLEDVFRQLTGGQDN